MANSITDSFKIKEKITGGTSNDRTNVELMVPLKYLSNFWRTIEMNLINYESNLDINWSKTCSIVAADIANQGVTFTITDTCFSCNFIHSR